MARSRNIKPGFYKNEDLAECSLWTRLMFPGLWMLADREGRLEDRPKRIKGELFPYDNMDIEQCLQELEHWGFIERYVADGKKVIVILNFLEHQTPHGKEQDSDLPDKDGFYTSHERGKNGLCTGKIRLFKKGETVAQDKNGASTVQESDKNALIPDSLNLIPESNSPTENSCPELPLKTDKDDSPIIFNLPLNQKHTYHAITQHDIDYYTELYPAVDVSQEIRKMIGWLDSNQKRRKTKTGVKAFITNWLAKEQDRNKVNGKHYETHSTTHQETRRDQRSKISAAIDQHHREAIAGALANGSL